jgi:DnaD/phage-associated family protein
MTTPPPEPAATPFFPPGARTTALPSLVFSELLPAIEDEAELRVTLYGFYLCERKRPGARWFTAGELRAEAPLARTLARLPGGAGEALQRGLAAAVERGTLLRGLLPRGERELAVYALNAPGAAQMLARLGAVEAGDLDERAPAAVMANIFVLYEENVGVISPLLSERLREAEAQYPWPWIEAAFREAVALNRRSWRYIERILQRWEAEGPDVEAIRRTAEGAGRRSLAGRYWRHVRR